MLRRREKWGILLSVRGSAGIGRQARLRILWVYARVGSSPISRRCRSGGIGRRARFRSVWWQHLVGSTPIFCIFLLAKNLDFIGFSATFIYRNRRYVRYDLQSQCFFDSQRLFFLRFPFKVVESVRRTDIAVSCESLNCAVIHIRIIQKR